MDRALEKSLATAALLFLVMSGTNAAAAGNPANGKQLFARCAVCHKVDSAGSKSIGPNLFGVSGRKAGTLAGFNYSKAMASAGFTWSDDKLKAYIQNPRTVVPGNRMPYAGGLSSTDADDIVAYLDTQK